MKLSDAVDDYGTYRLTRAHVSPATWRGEWPGLRAFAEDAGDPDVAEVDVFDIDDWWDNRLSGLSDSTRATRLAQLRSFFRWLIDTGQRTDDPTRLLRAPAVTPEVRQRLSADDLLRLLDVARTPRDRALLALASNLALRGSEIARLRWRDIRWGERAIVVHIDKTHQADEMPLSADLLDELVRWAPYAITGGTDYLIPSQHVGPQGVTYRWESPVGEPYAVVKYALEQIGWDSTRYEGVHTIRRSVARLFFDKVEAEETFDSALLATMTLLHHSRPETTLAYIGRDRATMARDRILKGQRFLSALAAPITLRSVS
jgi:integrase